MWKLWGLVSSLLSSWDRRFIPVRGNGQARAVGYWRCMQHFWGTSVPLPHTYSIYNHPVSSHFLYPSLQGILDISFHPPSIQQSL